MLKTLIRKKLWEFRARRVPHVFPFLLAVSLLPVLRLLFDAPLAAFVSFAPWMLAWLMAPISATLGFEGEFSKQAGRFLEYLPLRRSAIWATDYLSGLAVLCLAAFSLLWLEVLLFHFGTETDLRGYGLRPDKLLTYLVPGRVAMAVSCGSILFWMFSVAGFPAACLDRKDGLTVVASVLMLLVPIVSPFAIIPVLALLGVFPSGLAISPVLLTSAMLYSAGSCALFVFLPKHTTPTKRGLAAIAIFLAITAIFLGQLYIKHFAWRVLDPSLPLLVERVYQPHLEGQPDFVLADVHSYRSGQHCVSIQVENGTCHDLGRGLALLGVPMTNSGLLHFGYDPYPGFGFTSECEYFVSMAPDGTRTAFFKIQGDRVSRDNMQWLDDKKLLLYSVYSEKSEGYYLYVVDSTDRQLKRFAIGGWEFLASQAGQALALAPTVSDDFAASGSSAKEEKPYMIIDLDRGSTRRFATPDQVVCFAKNLRRAICERTRIRNGRRYKSYVLIEVPALDERPILSEDEFPAEEVASQVELSVDPRIASSDSLSIPFLKVNETFDTMVWTKQRVDGDYFRYSIVLVDLNTGRQRVAVPESAATTMPVVGVPGAGGRVPFIHRFISDQADFVYSIGPQVYFCDTTREESVLLADNTICLDAREADRLLADVDRSTDGMAFSPSGRGVLRYRNVWHRVSNERETPRLNFSAVEAFESGKPRRLYTGTGQIAGALWLDDQRIIFYEEEAIYVLDSAGQPPRQVFPPVGGERSE